jgi:AcrR family transcriptional regulator
LVCQSPSSRAGSAGLGGRSPFYAHYRDKDDLLRAGFEDIRAALATERDVAEKGAARKAELLQPTLAVFRHVGEHRHFWESRSRKGGADLVTRILREGVMDLFGSTSGPQFPDAKATRTQLEAAIQFVTGACMGLLVWCSTTTPSPTRPRRSMPSFAGSRPRA